MKTIEEIDLIIDMYLQCYDLSYISRKLKISEQTIKKYIKDFNDNIELLTEDIDSRKRYEILKELTEGPSYDSTTRTSRVYDKKDLEMVKKLAEGGYKSQRLLYNEAKEKGLNVSYSTFWRMLKSLEKA